MGKPKVELPDEIVTLIKELQEVTGVPTFTAAVCMHIKLGHAAVMERFSTSHSTPTEQRPAPAPTFPAPPPSNVAALPNVAPMPTRNSKAERLRNL